MNDKYFACTTRGPPTTRLNTLEKDEHVPVFGERRSPSCVEDWLEINDFDCVPAPIDSPAKLKTRVAVPKNALTIQTRFLQRENSFRSSGGSSARTVKSIIESFSKSNQVDTKSSDGFKISGNSSSCELLSQRQSGIQASKHFARHPVDIQQPSKLSRSAFVSVPTINHPSQTNATVVCAKKSLLAPRITSVIPKTHSSSLGILPSNSPSVLASLRPARRKKRQAPRAEDIYTNAKEKQQIMQALSHIDIRSSDDNYDVVIESFSLEGEFV